MNTTSVFKHSAFGVASAAAGLVPLLLSGLANAAPSSLGCQVNGVDGTSLRSGQTLIQNTTAKDIAQGTVIEITTLVVPGIGKAHSVSSRVSAPALEKGSSRSVGDSPRQARSCTANIALVQPKTTVDPNRRPPVLGK